jgi:hypothetical protein
VPFCRFFPTNRCELAMNLRTSNMLRLVRQRSVLSFPLVEERFGWSWHEPSYGCFHAFRSEGTTKLTNNKYNLKR